MAWGDCDMAKHFFLGHKANINGILLWLDFCKVYNKNGNPQGKIESLHSRMDRLVWHNS